MPKSKKQERKSVNQDSENPRYSKKEKPLYPAFAPSEITQRCDNPGVYNQPLSFGSNQLYVSNLPQGTNMSDLSKIFTECIAIALGVNNENEPNAAYLEFRDPEATARACEIGKKSSIRGNLLIVSPKIGR